MSRRSNARVWAIAGMTLLGAGWAALAAPVSDEPPTLLALQDYDVGDNVKPGDANSSTIRSDALHDAALSFGARGGLAHRTWELARIVSRHREALDGVFDFRPLQMPVQRGLRLNLPVITEGEAAAKIDDTKQRAALTDKLLQIKSGADLTLVTPRWTDYLSLDPAPLDPPPTLLLPRDDDERKAWRKSVAEGYAEGVAQADDIFDISLDRLTEVFVGRVRSRELVAQHIVTPPYVNVTDHGITGDATTLRIGDREVHITAPAVMNQHPAGWVPTER